LFTPFHPAENTAKSLRIIKEWDVPPANPMIDPFTALISVGVDLSTASPSPS
jgi:hypothetical protein